MKAFASAMLGVCAVGFSSAIGSAQTHPLVGKWQTKVQWTGDIDMVITNVRADNFIEGTFAIPRAEAWNCTFSDKVEYRQCMGYYDGTWLTVTVPKGAKYTVQIVGKRLKGKVEAFGNVRDQNWDRQ
jgi:redox-regulated HSP33 family molecular chaperone